MKKQYANFKVQLNSNFKIKSDNLADNLKKSCFSENQ